MAFTAYNAPPARAQPTVVQANPVVAKPAIPKRIPELEKAFADRPDLLQQLQPGIVLDERTLLNLSQYIISLKHAASQPTPLPPTESQPASKKRKLDEVITNGSPGWTDKSQRASHNGGDVSFSVPQRKKLRLEWLDAPSGGIRAANPTSGDLEFGVSWQDVDQVFAIPVPEKAKKQHNFVVIPKGAHGLLPLEQGGAEAIVWTVMEPGPKDVDAPQEPAHTSDLLNAQVKHFGKKVVLPNSNEFKSALPDANRKGENAYHVKAHRGSKDGFLYFTSRGILFAFKKPILFLPFEHIDSVSYTSVLQRTFNLNIATSINTPDGETKEEEIEFSMLDQADFAGIDEYIKRHELHDASLAASRKAKVYDVNKGRGKKGGEDEQTNGHAEAGAGGDEVGEDGLTDLQRAEQQLQDEEDEMEEDYVDEGSDEEYSSDGEEDDEGPVGDAGEGEEEEEEEEEEDDD